MCTLNFEPTQVSASRTLFVGGTGAGNFTTIQSAIDSANIGDTIFIYSGLYEENLYIYKSLKMLGENRNTSIIDGEAENITIAISANNVEISGLTVTNSGRWWDRIGIDILNVTNCKIDNNILESIPGDGIHIRGSTGCEITNNEFTSNIDASIDIEGSSDNIIKNNIFDNNGGGIIFESSCWNIISKNILINNCYHNLYLRDSSNNSIEGNNISDNKWSYESFSLYNSSGNIIKNNNISNNYGNGINLWYDSNNTKIEDNYFVNNSGLAILSYYSSGQTISNNNISHNNMGVALVGSSNCNITGNNFSKNGVTVYSGERYDYETLNISQDNQIDGKTIYYFKNTQDILLDNSSVGQVLIYNCTNLTLNKLQINNSDYGIDVMFADNITVTNCNVSDNMGSLGFYESSDITLINNSLLNNSEYIIVFTESTNIKLIANKFEQDGIILKGSLPQHFDSHMIASNNTIGGKPLLYYGKSKDLQIDGLDAGQIIIASCTDMEVKNLKLINTSIGMQVYYSTNIEISECNISSNKEYGMYLYSSSYNTINNNEFWSNENAAINVDGGSQYNVISDNYISDNDNGINLETSANNNSITKNYIIANLRDGIDSLSNDLLIIDNLLQDNYCGIFIDSSTNCMIRNNTVSSNREGIEVRASDIIITNNKIIFNDGQGINLWRSKGNLINNTIIYNYNTGINADSIVNMTLENNNISFNHRDGISLRYSKNVSITNNEMLYNEAGSAVSLSYSTNVTLTKNNIKSEQNAGIFLENSSYNKIFFNNIRKTRTGISLSSNSNYNRICGNNLSFIEWAGVELRQSSNNTIEGNNVTNNHCVISIEKAFYNRIFHNNFINNKYQRRGDTSTNFWNTSYPSGGNFWSDYNPSCPDKYSGPTTPQVSGNPDGICDEPYELGANHVDFYPLKEPRSINYTSPEEPPSILEPSEDDEEDDEDESSTDLSLITYIVVLILILCLIYIYYLTRKIGK